MEAIFAAKSLEKKFDFPHAKKFRSLQSNIKQRATPPPESI
jgi:hypothetical protein